jgi:FtsZ-binding cell division protein ZapB
MTDKELMQMALNALIDAADSQNWEMQQNIDQHGEWYRRSVYLKQSTTNSQEAIKALRIRLSQCERCGEANPAEIHTCSPQEPVLQDIEQYRLQMAAISTAAIGYWKEGDGILPDYDTPALRDVAKLYSKYEALYATPPQREWQGLTDEEKLIVNQMWNMVGVDGSIKAIETRLKEKNSA